MRAISLESHYDARSDILAVWSRQPQEVFSIEPIEGIILRTDAVTDEFIGYTILNCVDRFIGIPPDRVSLPMVPEEWLAPLREHLKSIQRSGECWNEALPPKRPSVRK